ncbi:MAG TPA: rRNA maturation RNase YbeY [Longimicrobiales bacterium]|nr:rRNA maturation RNase YbeY [Longimicrobiales bacterium]
MAVHVDVNLEALPPGLDAGDVEALLGRAVHAVHADAGRADGTVSLTLLDDRAITALNGQYLDAEGPTDVIAFTLNEADGAPLGDIYIGADQAARQAEAHGVPLREELVRLAVHGTLHVLGHDHPAGPERETSEMWALQERLVGEIGDR